LFVRDERKLCDHGGTRQTTGLKTGELLRIFSWTLMSHTYVRKFSVQEDRRALQMFNDWMVPAGRGIRKENVFLANQIGVVINYLQNKYLSFYYNNI
jgi:hypothetical protein